MKLNNLVYRVLLSAILGACYLSAVSASTPCTRTVDLVHIDTSSTLQAVQITFTDTPDSSVVILTQNTSDPAQIDRAFSMALTAQISDRDLVILYDDVVVPTCSQLPTGQVGAIEGIKILK